MSDLEKCWEDDEETAPPRVEIIPSKASQRVAKQESKPRAAPSVAAPVAAAPVAVAPTMEEKAKPENAALQILGNTLQMIQRQNTLIERYEKMLEKMEHPSEKRPLPTPEAEDTKNVNDYVAPPPRKKQIPATGYLATAHRPPIWSAPLQRNPTNSASPNMARKNYLELKKKLYKY